MFDSVKRLADSRLFSIIVIAAIILAGVLVGIETDEHLAGKYHTILHLLDNIILAIFVIEIIIKMAAEWPRPLNYFKDPWNIFDFLIVAVCLLPFNSQYVAVFRLVRLLRVFKLITALPRLQILIGALIKSIPSMNYVGILLLLLTYVYAVMGVFLFGKNDPDNFHDLGTSFLTLFKIVTLEGWADIFDANFYGTDPAGYARNKGIEPVPQAAPVASVIYFVTFILLGTMIMLNLFIGVIINGMEEAKAENEELDWQQSEEQQNMTDKERLHHDIRQLMKQVDAVRSQLQSLEKRYD